jgi:hypothetical protein
MACLYATEREEDEEGVGPRLVGSWDGGGSCCIWNGCGSSAARNSGNEDDKNMAPTSMAVKFGGGGNMMIPEPGSLSGAFQEQTATYQTHVFYESSERMH